MDLEIVKETKRADSAEAAARRTPVPKGARNRPLSPPKESAPKEVEFHSPQNDPIPDFVYETREVGGVMARRKVAITEYMASIGCLLPKKDPSAASAPIAVAPPSQASLRGRAEATGGVSAR